MKLIVFWTCLLASLLMIDLVVVLALCGMLGLEVFSYQTMTIMLALGLFGMIGSFAWYYFLIDQRNLNR